MAERKPEDEAPDPPEDPEVDPDDDVFDEDAMDKEDD